MICDSPAIFGTGDIHKAVSKVSQWAFVLNAKPGFNGRMFVRYEVWSVLPILDANGRVYRHLRPYSSWAWSPSHKGSVWPKAAALPAKMIDFWADQHWAKGHDSRSYYRGML